MKDVYELRRDEEKYCIFPLNERRGSLPEEMSALVVIHLHYKDSVEKYRRFIGNIPKCIDTVVTSADPVVLDEVKQRWGALRHIDVLHKENRGRDVSSLLVTCSERVAAYKYICFVHDKKAREAYLERDVTLWQRDLWENTIGSESYICNILYEFESNPKCGLMLVPEPIGEETGAWYRSFWGDNFSETRRLVRELNLHTNISETYPPIAIGTAFWARTTALEKLFQKKWTYESFPEEPLSSDGTISHAVERVLPFVAQDAGYETFMCMSDAYVKTLLSLAQDYSMQLMNAAERYIGINSIFRLRHIRHLEEIIADYAMRYPTFYIFGAGEGGKDSLFFLLRHDIVPKGFIVSKKTETDQLCGYPVYGYDEVREELRESGVMVSAKNPLFKKEIADLLEKDEIRHYIEWWETI